MNLSKNIILQEKINIPLEEILQSKAEINNRQKTRLNN